MQPGLHFREPTWGQPLLLGELAAGRLLPFPPPRMVRTVGVEPPRPSAGAQAGPNALGSPRHLAWPPAGSAAAHWLSFGKEDFFQQLSLFTHAKNSQLRCRVLKASVSNVGPLTCAAATTGAVSSAQLPGGGQTKIQEHMGGFTERGHTVIKSW